MVVDTSVWLDYLYYQHHPDAGDYLDSYLSQNGPIEMLPVIYQEVLQGMRSDQEYQRFRQNASHFDFYYFTDPFEAAHQTATLYHECRRKGLTIRKSNDCLIAHYCISYNLSLLTVDTDFDHIAKVFSLKMVRV